MLAAVMPGVQVAGFLLAHRNDRFCHSATFLLVAQFFHVEIIDVPFVLNWDVPAVWTVNVTGLGHNDFCCAITIPPFVY